MGWATFTSWGLTREAPKSLSVALSQAAAPTKGHLAAKQPPLPFGFFYIRLHKGLSWPCTAMLQWKIWAPWFQYVNRFTWRRHYDGHLGGTSIRRPKHVYDNAFRKWLLFPVWRYYAASSGDRSKRRTIGAHLSSAWRVMAVQGKKKTRGEWETVLAPFRHSIMVSRFLPVVPGNYGCVFKDAREERRGGDPHVTVTLWPRPAMAGPCV